MNKRNIFYSFVVVAILAFSLASCSRMMDDTFDTPSTERVRNVIETCKNTLKGAKDGWYLDYTTPDGYNAKFVMQFGNHDSVQTYADFSDIATFSSYSFNYGQGPVLSFDTYGQLHAMSDPQTSPVGVGHGGDFEFVIVSVTADSIVMNGRKNRDRVVLRKAIAGQANKIRLMKELDFSLRTGVNFFHGITVNGAKADLMLSKDKQKAVISTATGKVETIINYVNDGFELTDAINVGGLTVKKFNWDNTTKKFVVDGSVTSTLDGINVPTYSIGTTADQVIGNYYDVLEYSPAMAGWYSTLASAFANYKQSEVYLKAPRRIETASTKVLSGITTVVKRDTAAVDSLISYSFLFNKTGGFTVWNNFKGTKLTKPREDQILLTQGVRDGENANDLNLNKTVRNIPTNFFNTSGFTVVIENSVVYLVNIKDSKIWMKLQKGTSNPRIQTIYNAI